MPTRPYVINGETFPSQKELDQRVKEIVRSAPRNVVFQSDLLAGVVNEYHPEVRAAGQQSTGYFEVLDWSEQRRRGMDTAERFRGGHVVMTYFEPLHDWRDVTVHPWRKGSARSDVKRALREKIAGYLPRPQAWTACAKCGTGVGLEYEHVTPTFNAIANQCLDLMSEAEIESRFGYNKFVSGRDELCHLLPDDHPAVARLFEAHETNEWLWLCKTCHRGADNALALQPALAIEF